MAARNVPEIDTSNTNGQDESNDSERTPVAKKLKSSPTDLIIRLGEEKYEYHCHSMVMAYHSAFIDAALASPMQESQTRVIDLPDVSPKIWNLMMSFLDCPEETRQKKMLLSDIVLAAEKFDEYEFPNGIAFCGMNLSSVYASYQRALDSDTPSLSLGPNLIDALIKSALRCNAIQLKGCMPAILSFFRRALTLPQEVGNHLGGIIFKQEQLSELAPLIADNNLLGDGWTKEEILSPLFPKHFLTTKRIEYENRRFGPMYRRHPTEHFDLQLKRSTGEPTSIALLHSAGTARRTAQTPTYVGGVTPRNRSMWNESLQNARIMLQKSVDKNWVIAVPSTENNEARPNTWRVLWQSPLSFNCVNFPPTKPWIKVANDAPVGSLKVITRGSGTRYNVMGRIMEDEIDIDLRL